MILASQAPNLRTLAGQRAHYAAVRERLDGAPSPRVAAGTTAIATVRAGPPVVPPRIVISATPGAILAEVCARHGVTIEELAGPLRLRHLVLPRHEAAWRLRQRGLILKSIGRILGGRDERTIRHAIDAHEARMKVGTVGMVPRPIRRDVLLVEDRVFDGPLPPSRRIIEETAIKYRTTPNEMMGRWCDKALVLARQEAMWRMRHELGMSYPQIGVRCGDRDHSTALYGVRKHQARIDAGQA